MEDYDDDTNPLQEKLSFYIELELLTLSEAKI